MKLKNKTAVLVGTGRTLDQEVLALFHTEGASTAYIQIGGNKENVRNSSIPMENVLYCPIESNAPDVAKETVQNILENFGRIDTLVCNAIPRVEEGNILELSDESWLKAANIALTGQYLLCKNMIPSMPQGSTVTFVSSSMAMRAEPNSFGVSALSFGVLGLMRSIAADYSAQGIRVNAVCPSTCIEEMSSDAAGNSYAQLNLMKRNGAAGEIAKSILFLSTEDSSFISGTTLPVDGGLHIF